MLDNRRERHGKRLGKLADRGWTSGQSLHHDSPGRIRQCMEQEIERGALVSHALMYARLTVA